MGQELSSDILVQSIEHSNLSHTISRLSGDMELTYVNQAFIDETGYERGEILGRNCRFLQGDGTNPETVEKIKYAIARRENIDVEILNYKKNGAPFWNRLRMSPVFDKRDHPVAYIGIQSNITYIREQQRQEQERQKMEALGRLTGNISHEIKNALQPVRLMTDALLDWENLNEDQIAHCVSILKENVYLADNIVKDVLHYVRSHSDALEKRSVQSVYLGVVRFIKNLAHSRISYEEVIYPNALRDDLSIEVNMNQLYQIIMNLINNALYAMRDRGTLTLHWSCPFIDAESAGILKIKPGQYLCMGIEDNGCGIDERILPSIFDPFFSTKQANQGSGLGLSISYKIVKGWGGTINMKSKLKKGSMVSVYIPVLQ